MGTILGNAATITMDGERRIFKNGAVAYEGDRIVAVGRTDEVRAAHPDYDYHDMKDHVIMPGLVNGHVHLTQALIKGCADDVSLIEFLANRVWQLMGHYNEDEAFVSAQLCMLEMVKSGTTTFAETLLHSRYGLDGMTRATVESGMRGILAKSVMDIATYATRDNIMCEGMVEDGDECIRQAIEWQKRAKGAGDGRVQVWLGPRPVGSSTKEILEKVAAAAKEHDMGICIHFCEVPNDVEYMKNTYGMAPGEFAEATGIFTNRTLLAHGVWLEKADMEAMKRHGTTVVHCPASNAKLASGFCKVPQLLEVGANVALGTDAATCDNAYDMFVAMRLAGIVHKGTTLDPEVVPAETVLELATVNGARAIGMADEIGSLEVGKKADIITIDCNHPRLVPNVNPVSMVVYSANGDDVDNTIIDGKFVVKNRQVLTMDEEAILADAKAAIPGVLEKANVINQPRWPMV